MISGRTQWELARPCQVLAQYPECKLVAVSFTGFNHVDLEACKKRGISVVALDPCTLCVLLPSCAFVCFFQVAHLCARNQLPSGCDTHSISCPFVEGCERACVLNRLCGRALLGPHFSGRDQVGKELQPNLIT
eukprot:4227021-Amphidinium_carterae.1